MASVEVPVAPADGSMRMRVACNNVQPFELTSVNDVLTRQSAESTRGASDVQMGDAVIVWRSEEAPAGQTLGGEHASCHNARGEIER